MKLFSDDSYQGWVGCFGDSTLNLRTASLMSPSAFYRPHQETSNLAISTTSYWFDFAMDRRSVARQDMKLSYTRLPYDLASQKHEITNYKSAYGWTTVASRDADNSMQIQAGSIQMGNDMGDQVGFYPAMLVSYPTS